MAVDLSVYGNQKTLNDYANARQDRADQAQQLYQQGQLQNLDLATKKNLYATQIMSQVSASGDQNAYNMGLQHLQQAGIDTSQWAPDVQTGAQQAQAARMAASPYGALVNAATKIDTLGNQVATINGAPGSMPFTSSLIHPSAPNVTPQQIAVAQQPGNPPQQTVANQDPVAESLAAIQAQQNVTGVSPAQRPDLIGPPAQATQALGANVAPTFSFRPQSPDENIATYQKNRDMAFQAWKEDPANVAAHAKAEAAGKDSGALPLEAVNSQEITDRLRENVQKLLSINETTPDSSYTSPDTKAYFSKRLGSGADAGRLAEWNQIDQQQILSDYGQLVKSGAIKGSRQIFQALQTGSGIPVDEPKSARKDLLNNLLAEIENKNTTTQNVNAALNGGARQQYQEIPTTEQVAAPKMGAIEDGHVFLGGDPSDPSRWKKVQ